MFLTVERQGFDGRGKERLRLVVKIVCSSEIWQKRVCAITASDKQGTWLWLPFSSLVLSWAQQGTATDFFKAKTNLYILSSLALQTSSGSFSCLSVACKLLCLTKDKFFRSLFWMFLFMLPLGNSLIIEVKDIVWGPWLLMLFCVSHKVFQTQFRTVYSEA